MEFTPLKNTVAAESHHTQTLGTGVLTLSIPLHAACILMQATTQNIRFTLDGTTPTASSGFQLIAGDRPTFLEVTRGLTFKFIRETSGAVLEYEYGGS